MVDDHTLTDAVIPTSVLGGVLDIAAQKGIVTDSWFAGTGLTADQFGDPATKISFRQGATILRRALRALPQRPIGMQVGRRDVLLSFGILGFAMRACETAAEAFAIGLELHQAAGSLVDASAETIGDDFALRLSERAPDPEILPFLCEEAFSSSLLLMHALLGTDVVPTRLEFAYPSPAYVADYRRFFRCPILFDSDANRMLLPTRILDSRIPTHNPAQLAAALDATRRLIDPSDRRPDVVAAVEALLRQNLRRTVTMGEVAERMHITERTLRRRLADSGYRFGEVRDRVRRQRATLLLRESKQPIAVIAAEVGFSDGREFRRAYARWTGKPPSAERSS